MKRAYPQYPLILNSCFLILVLSFLPFFALAEEITLQPPEVLISPADLYSKEEVLYLEGKATPGALVEIQLEKDGQEAFSLSALADSVGAWVVSQRLPLSSGDYGLKARQSLASVLSEWSASRPLKSVSTGVRIFDRTVLYPVIGIAAAILVLPLAVFLLYFSWRIRLYKKNLKAR